MGGSFFSNQWFSDTVPLLSNVKGLVFTIVSTNVKQFANTNDISIPPWTFVFQARLSRCRPGYGNGATKRVQMINKAWTEENLNDSLKLPHDYSRLASGNPFGTLIYISIHIPKVLRSLVEDWRNKRSKCTMTRWYRSGHAVSLESSPSRHI